MENLNTVWTKTRELNETIRSLLHFSTYDKYDDLSDLKVDYQDNGQLFLLDELREIMDKLSEAEERISYLSLPIMEVSRLCPNESGRYKTLSGYYYTCGSCIEALVMDEYHQIPHWIRTYVEHDGKDYYLVGYQGVSLNDLTVRVRTREGY